MSRTGRTTLTILACCALVTFTVLCGVVAAAVIDVNTRLSTTFQKIDTEIDEAHRLTLEAGLTAMEARKASAKESAMLDVWNAQIATTMSSVQATMAETARTVASIRDVTGAATSTLETTQQTVQALQAPISQATTTLQAAQRATEAVNALATDPNITATIANVEGTTAHLDATSKDVEQAVHSYTHPTWAKKLFGWTLSVVHALSPL